MILAALLILNSIASDRRKLVISSKNISNN